MTKIVKRGRVDTTCEVCGHVWSTPRSLVTRACSRKCGAKLNHKSSKDPSKWIDVNCTVCNSIIHKRISNVGAKSFCSRKCRSIGMALYANTREAKVQRANGIKRGVYTDINGTNHRYDSSYELDRMKELDYVEKHVLSWKRCDFAIPYFDKDGIEHHYNPDFLIQYDNNLKVIEEIKGRLTENDIFKIKAGKLYAESNGMHFVVDQRNVQPILPLPKLKPYTNDYGTFIRPTEESIFVHMSLMIADRSTCLRKKVAAVFTDTKMQRVLCFGYNGNVSNGPNQCDSLEEGVCGCVHAEINALTKSETTLAKSTCFVTLSPCLQCAKVLINRDVSRVIYYETYRNAAGIQLLRQHGVVVEKFDSIDETTSTLEPINSSKLPELTCCGLDQILTTGN